MTAVVYVAIIAVATSYIFVVWGEPLSLRTALLFLFPVQIIAVLFCAAMVMRCASWRSVGFGRLQWSGMLWFLPSWVILAVMAAGIAGALTAQDIAGLGIIGIAVLLLTTLLIAFGEEVVFRGILLRGAMTRLTVPFAMFVSAFSFGLFHLVNRLAGQGATETSQQVLFAFLVGFFLAPIALRVGNLWPLIIWHWLWNIAVILGQVAAVLHPFALIGMAIQAVISIWLWTDMIRKARAD
ncbi:CPBP family intramembrane glutamic endopeptidase [Yoonia algicola]|uniref:CPBP family intramembrane glutamic endopeptidase n=1 Tax=Yoonia algicola TaxID=3137368 RepID=A0AAN0NE28_9RHOB